MPRQRSTTHFPSGVTNSRSKLLSQYPQLDPFKISAIEDDFVGFATGAWTVVETQAGATQAVTDGLGGRLLLTNSAADNDVNFIRSPGESFLLSKTKKAWFRAKFQISNATDAEFYAGFAVASAANPFTGALPDPGIGFHLADGAAAVQFHMDDGGTAYAKTSGIHTIVAATDVELGFVFDPVRQEVVLYVNGSPVSTITDVGQYPDAQEVAAVISVKNGSASARTMNIDYILAACER